MSRNTLTGDDKEVFLRQNSRTDYGPNCLHKLLEFISLEEAIEEDLISLMTTKVTKYFQDNPERYDAYKEAIKKKQGFYNEKMPTAGFLATKEKEMQDFVDQNKRRK